MASSDQKKYEDFVNHSTASASSEVVFLYGKASAEFIKGYRGIDNQNGFRFNKSHKDISSYRINPEFKDNNIKQQAGFSAEVLYTSKENARRILEGDPNRVARSDDTRMGTNHPVVDHVVVDKKGNIIDGSGSQMKFVNDEKTLIKRIAEGEGGGKTDLSRYRGKKLLLPTEQVETAKAFCDEQAKQYDKAHEELIKKNEIEKAKVAKERADYYRQAKKDILLRPTLSKAFHPGLCEVG
ncbi:hypothetical protein [Ectothiorhodospira sp. BSL-9]|uniref:hypothetical protein n=1 Tax=Ectothiorhodospira sp. BSL-9 TaxID=1442136 RepID=UPI000A97D000|nr:hypothetical protein [Ectothiorhodospira sp. BSL-9]